MTFQIFPPLEIPETLAAGPGPGNTDARVLRAFSSAGVADHMQGDVLRGMIECKHMLRKIWGTSNTYTFAVAGTGWSALDAMFSAVMPGDKVVAFANGTFSGIDALTLRIKAATPQEHASNPLDPQAASVTVIEVPHGQPVTGELVDAALSEHQPKWAFMAHWETGSGRVNDLRGFSDACERNGVMGLIDAVSSLGADDFSIDDYPGVAGWASCPQKGLCCLPLTYAPVSFTDAYVESLKASGAYSYVHNPIFEARHWGIVDGQDVEKGTYHRTHSGYAVAAFHEALRLTLQESLAKRAMAYRTHEKVLRDAVIEMGCEVTSDMPSLVVLNLPPELAGREMELVQNCRARGFGIWPTLSAPVQVRIGILNQLNRDAVSRIIRLFAEALRELGGEVDQDAIEALLESRYGTSIAA
ncbi:MULTISPECIES: aminotransferase class V-fold PLP-dependent enzyme [unclassified Ruegeria]|uniref:aminotransferase class V-fold PLP-dependent enzyme n=1 Tax=unclassified Ruegeria TaxID=2625375 RepID=UPI001487C99D|nr:MULTISPECIES: aminotransferase class V-fold PLP-dependent enzyme [unclassified Ruegeria]NOD36470.1 aminotransferase class V-fold PLP-dependent enzyme [Ruegeria sp. HKCCD7296]NOD49716.1 aminotransferase class V-fold PLP-dependent enzyme [Ruegeria sp. HKCCD5849]NOD53930.1 aminotransferase class V-fold PLP-dependent enzyme [Ruegeria sp. HKCCD5851]NOD68875.1 aminotransferase class V-fold PLP-dependent enzyme [Ruegeria sp. HKCCD7303]NOE43709.1 aminotransferase class V-fold PLP-dependent enzyme [